MKIDSSRKKGVRGVFPKGRKAHPTYTLFSDIFLFNENQSDDA